MRGSRSVATVAFLVLVGLVAFVTADGVEIPEPRERTAPDPCATPPPARSVGIAPGSRWKQDRRARADLQEMADLGVRWIRLGVCLLYTSPSPRDGLLSRMPSSA